MDKRENRVKKLGKRLQKHLTPNTNRLPAITGTSWTVSWRPSLASDDQTCIGVLLQVGEKLYWRVPDEHELASWPEDDAALLSILLDAATFRWAANKLPPPNGLALGPARETAGDTVNEILRYLWQHEPEKTLKKKAHYFHDKQEIMSLAQEEATHFHSLAVSTPLQHDVHTGQKPKID